MGRCGILYFKYVFMLYLRFVYIIATVEGEDDVHYLPSDSFCLLRSLEPGRSREFPPPASYATTLASTAQAQPRVHCYLSLRTQEVVSSNILSFYQ